MSVPPVMTAQIANQIKILEAFKDISKLKRDIGAIRLRSTSQR